MLNCTPIKQCVHLSCFRLCKPLDGNNPDDVSNLFDSLISNIADIVQYNEAFDSVTIENLCNIMAGGSSTQEEEESTEVESRIQKSNSRISKIEDITSFLKNTVHNGFENNSQKKTSLEYFADVNELSLKFHDKKCFDVNYDEMIGELQDISFNTNDDWRQWIYQTCTEFGWYQSSDQPGHPFTDYFPLQVRISVKCFISCIPPA